MCAALYFVLEAELMVYLTKITLGWWPVCVCAAVLYVLEAKLMEYLTKIIQGLSDQDYPRAGGRCACVLLCTLCWRQSSLCI